MAKKKHQKKKSRKASAPHQPKMAAKTKKVSKPAKRAKDIKGVKKKAESNRRKFARRHTTNLWVTEYSGDYQFIVAAADLSEGGIFLKGRMKTTDQPSELKIHLGTQQSLDVSAEPIYDLSTGRLFGTGYRFVRLSTNQTKVLRSYLRNLE